MKYCKCKITKEKIPIILNYGDMPIANSFSKKINTKNNYKMQIAFNEKNGVFQLVSAPKPKKLFNKIMLSCHQLPKTCKNILKK